MHRLSGFLIAFVVLLLLDYYAFQGIRFLTKNMGSAPKLIVTIAYWLLTVITIIGLIGLFGGLIERDNRFWRTVIFGSMFLNYFPKLILVLFVFTDDLQRFFRWIFQSTFSSETVVSPEATNTITRSEFLLKTGVVAASIPFIGTSWGIISGAHDYRVRKHTIYLPNLPKEFDGIQVAQISDIHAGSFFNKTAVKGGIELLNKQKPDLVFFTGDLVNDKASEVKDYIDVFNKVKAPLGTYSILGNHDYGEYVEWSSPAAWKQNMNDLYTAHKELGWELLLNENRHLTVDGASIGLMGIENWGIGFAQYGDMKKTYAGMEELPTKILLSHDPTHWDAQVRHEFKDVDLTLAGHTHGMQMGVQFGDWEWSPSKLRYKHWGGLYREGEQQLYVNRGYGYIGLPARIGMPPEITILTLKKGIQPTV